MEMTFYSKDGKITREITKEERDKFAASGDQAAMTDLLKEEISKAISQDQKIDAILKYLGVN